MTAELVLRWSLIYGQMMLALAACMAGWAALRGPRAQDRVLALDTLYVTAMLLFVVTGMRQGSGYFYEAVLVIGALGFVATVSLARFLMRGEVIE